MQGTSASFAYLPPIEGLRGLAILLVLVSHLGLGNVVPGGFGVTLFFFISGFLITRLLIAEHKKNGSISVGRFYLRRFIRLAPALLLMVACVVTTYWIALDVRPDRTELAASIFYFMNYYVISGGALLLPLGTLWSLAVEEHFYLVYPTVFGRIWRRPAALFYFLLGVLIAALLLRMVLVCCFHAPTDRTYLATDTRIDSIAYGALLSVLIEWKPRYLFYLERPAVIFAGLCALLISLLLRNDVFRETARYSLQGVAFLPLVYTCTFGKTLGDVRKALEHPVMLLVGRLSYSLYLWHFPVLSFIDDTIPAAPPFLRTALSVTLFCAIACASYNGVERPLQGLRKRLHAAVFKNKGALSLAEGYRSRSNRKL